MTTREDATRIAQEFLEETIQPRLTEEIVLAGVAEYPNCWVFGYNTRAYIETRSLSRALAGNGPLIVNRRTGAVRQGVSGLPVEDQLDDE